MIFGDTRTASEIYFAEFALWNTYIPHSTLIMERDK